ncbi:hypothetical protein SCE1572_20380 [Sorangium cellulosum So0157-2]|uniref:Uncharacterized protein n=2 Tax=Sorangium cellulosum TaxID=56 RepID=S4XVW7_SORCE|nr:hypothetical protein SCE1572_20380 [Sorangium cellulosum So0157-2]
MAAVMSVGLWGCVSGDGGGPSDDAAPGGQIGGVHVEEGGCDEERVDIGVDDVSPLGFSAREALSALSGERSAPLAWSKGGSATATVAAGELVAARFVRSTVATVATVDGGVAAGELVAARFVRSTVATVATVAKSGPGGAESTAIAADCADHLQLDVPLAFSTEDGAFDESFAVTLRVPQVGAGRFFHRIDLDALQGSYEVTEVDPTEFREIFVYLSGELTGSAVSGTISGIAESHPIGTGPDSSVSGQPFSVADF